MNKDGIDVFTGVFSKEECEEMRTAAYEVTYDAIRAGGYPHQPIKSKGTQRQLAYFVALGSPILNRYRTDERLVRIVQKELGDNVRQINNQVYYREPGDGEEFAWHQDTMFREPHIFKEPREHYLQTIIAIDDITEDNGAIEFIPGSHKEILEKPEDLQRFIRGGRRGKKYTCKAGDVMVWDVNIIHGSEQNNSDRQRMTYMNGFAKTENASMYPHCLIKGKIVKNLDPNLIP